MDTFSSLNKAFEYKLILNSSSKIIKGRNSCGEILKEKQNNIFYHNKHEFNSPCLDNKGKDIKKKIRKSRDEKNFYIHNKYKKSKSLKLDEIDIKEFFC